jgi:F-type H+-transporting ATPase subunit delta
MPQHQQHTSPLATAYARSLLELGNEQNQAEPIGQELVDLEKVLESDSTFETFLSSPAIGEVERGQVIEKVFRGRVSPLLANFLGVLNRKGRLALLRQIAAAYQELLEDQMGLIEVDVISAQRLTAEQLEEVRKKVSAALKREAVVHQYVDESIIGGLLIRVEDKLLDASVKAQLRAIRRQLLAARPR